MIINIRPRITAPFGSIDSVHKTPHTGVDVALPEGTELHAVVDSVVSRVVTGTDGLGNGVILRVGGNHEVIYGHMSSISVRPGDHLHAGDVIGLSGNTGHSTGPHLHLGLTENGHFTDPTLLIDAALKKMPAVQKHSGPFGGFRDALDEFNSTMHSIGEILKAIAHWLNPVTWWNALDHLFSSGALDMPLMAGTIIGIFLLMGGARWPKKWIAWGWALFWIMRGMVFG